MPQRNFNPSQDTSDQIRERKVNEVMEAFFGSDGYDDEMKTMVGELLDVHNGDKAQVERQIRELGFGPKESQSSDSPDNNDDYAAEREFRLAAEQAAREELEAERAQKVAEEEARRLAIEEEEKREEEERRKRRREREVAERAKKTAEEKTKKAAREKRAKRDEEERKRREQQQRQQQQQQLSVNETVKPTEQKKAIKSAKVILASKLAQGSAGLATGPDPSIRVGTKSCARGANRSLARGPNPELTVGASIMRI